MIQQLKDDLSKKWSLISLEKYNSIEEVRDFIVNLNPHSISLIPEKYFNAKWIPLILNHDCFLIQYIPSEYHTEEFCLKAIQRWQKNYNLLKLFKQKHKRVSKALFKINYEYFSYIPPEHLTSDMLIKAVSKSNYYGSLITKIPNKRILKLLVKQDWNKHYFSTVIKNIQFSDKDLLKILHKNHSPNIVQLINFNVELALKTLDLNEKLFKYINLCQHTNSVEEAYDYLNEKKSLIALISA